MAGLDFSNDPHRRFNILTGEWVLVSPHRTKRPWQGKVETSPVDNRPSHDPTCYLCPGNERAGGVSNPKYTGTYVFNNDFAALLSDSSQEKYEDGLLLAKGERGIGKVICFSPNHALTLPEMDIQDIVGVIDVWQNEYKALGEVDFINHIQIFENKGAIMGCSNPHPHGQIWAQSSVPMEAAKKGANQKVHFEKTGNSLLGDYLKQELALGVRIIDENEHFVSLVPFWAVWPYEAMIIPKRAMANILDMTEAEKQAYADILRLLTIRFDNLFQCSFPYSAGIHQSPVDGAAHPYWHWHMSFYPPLLRSATVKKFMVGYEMLGEPQRDISAEYSAGRIRELSTVHYKN